MTQQVLPKIPTRHELISLVDRAADLIRTRELIKAKAALEIRDERRYFIDETLGS